MRTREWRCWHQNGGIFIVPGIESVNLAPPCPTVSTHLQAVQMRVGAVVSGHWLRRCLWDLGGLRHPALNLLPDVHLLGEEVLPDESVELRHRRPEVPQHGDAHSLAAPQREAGYCQCQRRLFRARIGNRAIVRNRQRIAAPFSPHIAAQDYIACTERRIRGFQSPAHCNTAALPTARMQKALYVKTRERWTENPKENSFGSVGARQRRAGSWRIGRLTSMSDWMDSNTCSKVDSFGTHPGPDQVPSRERHTLPSLYSCREEGGVSTVYINRAKPATLTTRRQQNQPPPFRG